MLLEIAAAYGAIRFLSDLSKIGRTDAFKKAERQAAKQYNLVPLKSEPGVYRDRHTGEKTRMAYDGEQFFPTIQSVTDFEIAIRGRTYDFRS